MTEYERASETTKGIYVLIISLIFLVLMGCIFYKIDTEHQKEYYTYKAPLYKIETSGAISGGQVLIGGTGGGKISSATHYYTKDYKQLDDGSIQFTTIEGYFVRVIEYKISTINATYKKKRKYNQLFLVHPDDMHFVKVLN